MDRANVLIAAGGIIGRSVAWALASRGVNDIAVVVLDLAGVYASSEFNAGGARASWWQWVKIASCAATLAFFRRQRAEFGFREWRLPLARETEALGGRLLPEAALRRRGGDQRTARARSSNADWAGAGIYTIFTVR